MKRTIVIGMLGLGLVAPAQAQTAGEQAAILRDFQHRVADYAVRHQGRAMLPEAPVAATPAPTIFTLPVSMVFRQLIAKAIAAPETAPTLTAAAPSHRAVVLQPLPGRELVEFPVALQHALPGLPRTLEYRLVDNDLVIRDAAADVVVAVLPDAVGGSTTVKR